MMVTKTKLYTTNEEADFVPRAFIALTARTPHFRRDDVASRIVPFHMEKLKVYLAEDELHQEVIDPRDALMSEYARALNRVVATTDFPAANSRLRLADFAKIATRISDSMGSEVDIDSILSKLPTTQHLFATEEHDLFLLLDMWTQVESAAGTMGMETPNNGREIRTTELYKKLKELADTHRYTWEIKNAGVLGLQLKALKKPLGAHFQVEHGRRKSVR